MNKLKWPLTDQPFKDFWCGKQKIGSLASCGESAAACEKVAVECARSTTAFCTYGSVGNWVCGPSMEQCTASASALAKRWDWKDGEPCVEISLKPQR